MILTLQLDLERVKFSGVTRGTDGGGGNCSMAQQARGAKQPNAKYFVTNDENVSLIKFADQYIQG